jgi:phosphoribosylaminoimidazolecarboxamide formyltransferase/IMP cyclohydrolase
MAKIQTALLSVSDKSGLLDLARGLGSLGVDLISSGGTAAALRRAGLEVEEVSDYTGFPEMMDGRVKTLHPKVHGGILARRDVPEHLAAAKAHGIRLIDLVVVNLYPFERTVARPDVSLEEAIENIDIGGPTLVRSAAKNFHHVAVVTNPARYAALLEELKSRGGELSRETRAQLAVEAFGHTARYDAAIHAYLAQKLLPGESCRGLFPERLTKSWERAGQLRYGENPHQRAAVYREVGAEGGLVGARQLHGKELSFNNYLDLEAALDVVADFAAPAAAVIKHNTPCGVAAGAAPGAAFREALACDPMSAFGGIYALNRRLDPETAKLVHGSGFYDCIIAPGYDPEALEILRQRKDVRVLELPDFPEPGRKGLEFKAIWGGLLLQERDAGLASEDLKVVSKKQPTPEQLESLRFAEVVCKHVRSNAAVFAQGTRTVGIGGGQTSRVDAVIEGARKAGDRAKGSVMATDSFFPQSDAVEEAAKAGASAILHTGGSVKDKETAAVADKLGVVMVISGVRHFKH